ncbi:MAG: hypothetical protein HC795_08240 [Coleofasciculaceae cyanobacterium RL_1_1]|nr:hypothetical protein [Coleofasciculaceae cyanobacterium RL_1_1]
MQPNRRHIADDITSFLSALAALGIGGGSIALAAALILGSSTARTIAFDLLTPSIPVGIQSAASDSRRRAIESDSEAAARRAALAAINGAETAAAAQHAIERRHWQHEAEQRLAQLQNSHAAELQQAIAIARNEARASERQECERRCTETIDALIRDHQTDLERAEREAAEETNRRINEIEQIETERHAEFATEANAEIARLQTELENWQTKRDLLQADLQRIHEWEVESARHESKLELLENERYEFASKIEAIQNGSDAKVTELLECIAEERQAGYDEGYSEAASTAELEIEKLKTKLASLEIRLKDRRSREAFDSSLPTLKTVLNGEFKPILIGGEQRVGKGTFCCKILEHYGRHCGVVPLVYDNSEAHKPDGTWALNGIPATNNPYVMLDLLKSVSQKLDSRPIVTDDNIKTYVPIVIAIDELMTCLLKLPETKRQEFVEQLTYLYTRGAKAHVYLIVMNHSLQVQNMKSGETAILNGGLIDTLFLQIALGTGAMNKFVKDRGTAIASPDLEKYKAAYASEYVAAAFIDGKLEPMRHATHHGVPRSSRKPSDVPEVRIAPPPDWFPAAAKSICQSHVPHEPAVTESDSASDDPVGDEALRAAKSALEEAFAPKSDGDDIPQLAREHGLDATVTRRAIELKRSGKGITAIAAELNIARASKSRQSHPYQKLKRLLQAI